MKFFYKKSFAYLLNLLLPGLGHLFWRELTFGLFVFIVTAIAYVLFFISFVVSLGFWIKIAMLSLPFIFYGFTFLDLSNTINKKRAGFQRSKNYWVYLVLIGIAYQLLSPIAPINFGIMNFPSISKLESNSMAPIFSADDIVKSNRLAYWVNIMIMDAPILHSFPERYDLISYKDENQGEKIGFIIGLPGEELIISEGVLVVDGGPELNPLPVKYNSNLENEYWLVGNSSLMIATLSFGQMSRFEEIEFENCIGKVSKLF